jgi:hypothetical protein
VVARNAAAQTQHVVVNHRPRSSLLFFSRLMLEKFAGTPLAKHWQGTPQGVRSAVLRSGFESGDALDGCQCGG